MPSTVIEKSAYDFSTRTLSVWFRPSGRRYDYYDVPPEIYAAYKAAFSKGHYFNRHIRERFRRQWIAGEQNSDLPTV